MVYKVSVLLSTTVLQPLAPVTVIRNGPVLFTVKKPVVLLSDCRIS